MMAQLRETLNEGNFMIPPSLYAAIKYDIPAIEEFIIRTVHRLFQRGGSASRGPQKIPFAQSKF